MKLSSCMAVLAVVFCLLPFDPVCAEEALPARPHQEKVTGSVSMGLFNRYVFRGYELSRDSIVVQPSITLNYRGFSLSYWGNVDSNARDTQSYFPSDYDKRGKKWFNETDLTVSYSLSLGKVTLTAGYVYYNLKYADETEELFLAAVYDMLGKPTLSLYQDINACPGTYISLSLGHSFDILKESGITLDLGASFGYFIGSGNYWKTYDPIAGEYTGKKYRGFHDGMVKAGITIPLAKNLFAQPILQYWFPLSGDARKETGGNSYNPNGYLGDVFVWCLNMTYSF